MKSLSEIKLYLMLSYSTIIVSIIFLIMIISMIIYNYKKHKKGIDRNKRISSWIFVSLIVVSLFLVQHFNYKLKNLESKSFFKSTVNGLIYIHCIDDNYKNRVPYVKAKKVCNDEVKHIVKLEDEEGVSKINVQKLLK